MSHIVYLDDEISLTKLFELLFEDSPHSVTTFTDEQAAIEYCQGTPPDILFVDYHLAKMKGDEVAAKLPNQIKKILVTGNLEIESEYPFDNVIKKPFKLNELVDAANSL